MYISFHKVEWRLLDTIGIFFGMWDFLKNLFSKSEPKKEQSRLNREELLVKSAEGSAMAIRRFHGALDKLAEYDRQEN